MFLHFLKRELRSALTRPMVYLFAFVFALLAFGAVASDKVIIGGAVGMVHKNAPSVITIFVTVLSIFGLLFATAFCNNAALRDYRYEFDEIIFSTPVHKFGYFFGRFCGAFILSCLPFIGIFVGVYLATAIAPVLGWLSPDRLGDLHFQTVINEFAIFILPNMFIGCAIIFWLAHRFKSTVVSFVGAFIVIMAYIISGTLLSDMSNRTLAALLDTFGIRAYSVVSQYYSTADKNTIIPQFMGLLMKNRLIWLGVAVVVTALSYLNFSMSIRTGRVKKKAKRLMQSVSQPIMKFPETVAQRFDTRSRWLQFKSIFSLDLKMIVKNPVFIILVIFCAIIVVINMVEGFEYLGLKTYPITYKMTELIRNNTTLFTMIILIFFSGELLWRDRISHFNEVVNATPHGGLTRLIGHTVALLATAVIFHLIFILVAIIGQLVQGFTHIEFGVYFGMLALYALPSYAIYCCLFIFLQSVLNNRYIGYFISVLVIFVLSIILLVLDVETNMVAFAGVPSMPYSDMNGFGPAVTATIWFSIYWLLFGIFLLFIAGLFIHRQLTNGFMDRWRQAKKILTKKYALSGVVVLLLWIICGGWVYYNTLVLNTYRTSDETEHLQVKYEKTYKHFQNFPHPKITAVDYDIQIFPHQRIFDAVSHITLKNETDKPIDSLLFTLSDGWNMTIKIPGAKRILDDKKMNFRIFRLQQPLQPGDSLKMVSHARYAAKGFENAVSNSSVLGNGTFVNNMTILPFIGYNRNLEMTDINKRKKYGLPPRKRAPNLVKNCTQKCMKNYLTMGNSDWIPVTTKISTSDDQIAVAPGSLLKHQTKNGRNYYIYKVDHPSQNFYSFQSARYQVARKNWNGVKLEVYYSPKNPYNIGIMLRALQRSLTYYTTHFGPYYHKEARIIEFPRYASFAQSFPGTMPYSESMGFIVDLRDTTKNNMVEAVVAHEMAHQYWAHQETPAFMQGETMLTESFAEYSSLMVMHQTHDDMAMKNYLKYDYDRYLRGRGSERQKEVPLYKVENQSYIHYGKGSVILYSFGQMIGTKAMNTALRTFLEQYRYKNPPYPNTWDFINDLEAQTPDSLKYLIRDWLEKITFYDLRMKTATATRLQDGRYRIQLNITAQKSYADSLGFEKPAPIDDWIELGLFSDKDEKHLMLDKKVKVDRPEMTFNIVVDSLPAKAMIDPKRLYMEKVVKDNNAPVVLKK